MTQNYFVTSIISCSFNYCSFTDSC